MSFHRFRKHGRPGNTETNVDGGKKSCTRIQGISLNTNIVGVKPCMILLSEKKSKFSRFCKNLDPFFHLQAKVAG